MPRSAAQKITRDVQDAASDIRHVLAKAGPRIREGGQEVVSETAHRLTRGARDLASRAGSSSRMIATRAVREAKARPIATGAIVAAAVAALVGLAFLRRPGRSG